MAAPAYVDAVQSAVSNPSVWVTWDRNDIAATSYDVLRNGVLVATVGPFVPFNPSSAAHQALSAANPSGWNTAGAPPFDDTWDKCAWEDSSVAGGGTYSYAVRAYAGTLLGQSAPVSIRVQHLSDFGAVLTAPAPSGGDDLATLNALVAAAVAAGGGVIVLQAGTYLVSAQWVLAPGVLVIGQGRDVTKIHGTMAGGTAGNGPVVVGYTGTETTVTAALSADIAPGALTAVFASTSELAVGSVLRFVTGTMASSSAPAWRAANPGTVMSPGAEYDESNRWESNEVVAISGTTVTFRYPFSQPVKVGASIARIGEVSVGSRVKPIAMEALTVEGNVGTSGSNDYFKLTRFEATVGTRLAKVRFRYSNQHALELRTTHGFAVVDCDEPDHGANVTSQQQYTISGNRSGNLRVIASSFGTSGQQKQVSSVTFQRCPRFLGRHNRFYQPFNYAYDEHGANTRDWICENSYMEGWNSATAGQGTKRGMVFMGNSSFSGGGRGIVRNNRSDGGPCIADMQENSYGVRVLDNIGYDLQPNGNSPQSALAKGYGWDSPDDAQANWGAIKCVIARNAVFRGLGDGVDFGAQTSNFWGDGATAGTDQAGDGPGYLGVKDLIVEDNHFDLTGLAVRLRGWAPRTARFQVRRNSGSARYLQPALQAGSHWQDNADEGGYTAPAFTRTFASDIATNAAGWDPAGATATWIKLVRSNANSPSFTIVLSTQFRGRTSFFLSSDTANHALNLRGETLHDVLQQRTFVYSTTNPGSRQYGLAARHGGGSWDSDCYFAVVVNAATPVLRIFKRVTAQTATSSSTTVTQLGTDVSLAAFANNSDVILDFEVVGTTVRARAYQGAAPAFQVSVADTDIAVAGLCGVYDQAVAAQTNTFDTREYKIVSGSKTAQADFGSATAVPWQDESFPWSVRTAGDTPVMATVTLRRSDLFPIGTTVGIYPARAAQQGGPPASAAIASAVVDGTGLLTVTDAALASYTDYVAYALVSGEHRYARVRSTLDVYSAPLSWRDRVKARRTAIGTTLPGAP